MSEERASLVALAMRLQVRAEELGREADEDEAFVAALTDFNARTGAACTALTFASLYQSQEPDEFVDHLLSLREPGPDLALGTAELLLQQMHRVTEDPEITMKECEQIGRALEEVSTLPSGWALDLVTGGFSVGWSPEQTEAVVDFVSTQQAIETRDDLLVLTRAYLDARQAREAGVFQVLRERLISDAQNRLDLPELRSLVRAWARRGIITDDAAVARLRKRLGLSND